MHITSVEPNSLSPGVQGPLKGPLSSRVVLMLSCAIWALFLSILINNMNLKNIVDPIKGGGGCAPVAPPWIHHWNIHYFAHITKVAYWFFFFLSQIRGALNAVTKLIEDSPDSTDLKVITHSSGNFGQALAYAAELKGLESYVVMPNNAPVCKLHAVLGYGATVAKCEPSEQVIIFAIYSQTCE